MTPKLSEEIQRELDANNGFVEGPTYVVMSLDMYRQAMGVGSDEEFEASVAACKRGWEQCEAGQGIPLNEALQRLDEKYGLHR